MWPTMYVPSAVAYLVPKLVPFHLHVDMRDANHQTLSVTSITRYHFYPH